MKIEYRHLRWSEFIWDADLDSKTKLVAMYLTRHMNADHYVVWPSLALIAEKTGLCRRSVQNAIDALETAGWITRESGGPGKGSSRYMPVFPKAVERLMQPFSGVESGSVHVAPDAIDVAPDATPYGTSCQGISPENQPKKKTSSSMPRVKNLPDIPSGKEEIREFILAHHGKGLVWADEFWDYYEAANPPWHRNGKPIRSWKQTVLTWIRFAQERQERQNPTQQEVWK